MLKKLAMGFAILFLAACKQGAFETVLSGESFNSSSSQSQPPADRQPASAEIGFDVFKDVAEPMGQMVDSYYPATPELMPLRSSNQRFEVDSCDPDLSGKDRFADRIAYAIHKRMQPMKIDIGSSVAPLFNLKSDSSTYMANSLISHPFCRVTKETLQFTFENYRIPSDAVIAKAQAFTDKLNLYRAQALAGSEEGKLNSYKLLTKFMMCLGYAESLTTADSKESDQIAASLGFRRPAGVNLHNDSYQTTADSVLGIGLFQISNVVKWGDTYSCVTDWNRQFPTCPISLDVSKSSMVPILGSAAQTFNTYCGVSMVTRMFGVQINSNASKNTHPDNVVNGALKAPQNRCVTPFMNVNRSYNHFGPFQNVHDFTLGNILNCTMRD